MGVRSTVRQFFALERDVLVLSVAMFAFSLAYQMTGRYMAKYLSVLGATAFVVGIYVSFGNLLGALYPYPGGALSDRLGTRSSLTLFGAVSTVGFVLWAVAPLAGTISILGYGFPAWALVFLGLAFVQAWKSLGLGATFALVKQSAPEGRLATGFASTEVFRRVGFLVGPVLAGLLVAAAPSFTRGFQVVLVVGAVVALGATAIQHTLYESEADTVGKSFEGVSSIIDDLRALPSELRPLLVADTFVRFANGMAYEFFVLVVVDYLAVGTTLFGVRFSPEAYFGLLLGVEMVVALLVMVPSARLADAWGLKPVVAAGFAVYAVFPLLLVNAPKSALVLAGLFAFSGLRFAGLPAHKALVVGPATAETGGRVTGTYYLVRNILTIPSAALGGWLYHAYSPQLAFTLATVVGLLGVGYFVVFGERFEQEGGRVSP
ncbi:MFS transporter [Halospeciosus flavus]|uniref:MFS transporter n=1 Tax=Halospeciosus flavus TaxID=3032283 RepID=A0ABD5Z239_9EURY|nr:MFS transporter [Halospeciosus flavus]